MKSNFFGNYHTHTYRCHHASGDTADYVREARKAGLKELGMTDHVPLPDDWMPSIRMGLDELDNYIKAIEAASTPDFRVLKGVECEALPRYYGFYREELLGKKSFDYLLGAVHWFEYQGEWLHACEITSAGQLRAYTDQFIDAMESGLFSFFAHPDHFGAGWKPWDGNAEACSLDILAAAKATGSVLEINGNGFRKAPVEGTLGLRHPYPLPRFWELARDYGIKTVCSSDAHRPEEVEASMDQCADLAMKAGLEIVQGLPRSLHPVG